MQNAHSISPESYDNKVAQVLFLFSMFLYTLMFRSKDNTFVNNVFVGIRRIYIRALAGFFKKTKQQNDDLIYLDFIDTNLDISVKLPKSIRCEINKQTAHFTELRGCFNIDNPEYIDTAKQLVSSINKFMRELDVHIKESYRHEFEDYNTQELRSTVITQLNRIYIANAVNGIIIDE